MKPRKSGSMIWRDLFSARSAEWVNGQTIAVDDGMTKKMIYAE
ncbi:hypothetical protein J2T09_000903 [Neorhizobium huautlense]|uniref:Transposase n=1 Tax=Neorhizobium huautlense TaxID=67774 RepID=A0ABT9PNW1_9HYPH|nr:hypothetical protein [Neorhizobium huautlense]